MSNDELKVVVREEPEQTNLYKNKRVIEVNHAKNIISFWETNYTFRQIIELVLSVPELKQELEETIEAVHAADSQ
jgi:dihydroorotate dehydrogenase